MTTFGFTFYDFVVFVHILAVVLAFGVTFSYPLADALLMRPENRRHLAGFHRFQAFVGKRMIFPFAGLVLLAGLYLGFESPQWDFGTWWVDWGLVAIIAILALGATLFQPTEEAIIPIIDRDIAAAGDGEVVLSPEYLALAKKLNTFGPITGILIISTVFVMVIGARGGFL
jgi:hypothetical protein